MRQEDPRAHRQGAREVRRRRASAPATARASAPQLFDIIEPFADYAFNKSHAYGYGLVAYQTAYLKANYPVEYLACLLTSVKGNLDKAAVYLAECRAMGIQVLVPDVNRSVTDFAALSPAEVPDGVDAAARQRPARSRSGCRRCATSARASSSCCSSERDANGPFVDFYDFGDRVARAGAQQAHHRVADQGRRLRLRSATPARACSACSSRSSTTTLARRREREQGVMSLFGDWSSESPAPSGAFDERVPIPDIEFDKTERLRFEKEMLGLYVSDHPLIGAEAALRRKVDASIADLAELADGATGARRRRRHQPAAASSPRRAT